MTHLKKQGSLDFSVGYKLQTTWGFQEALVFSLEGLGCVLFVISLLTNQLAGMLIGVICLVAGILLLLGHLGNPVKAFYAVTNIRQSWMSRGAMAVGLLAAGGLLLLILQIGFGISLQDPGSSIIGWLFIIVAAFVLVYPGFMMSSAPATPFWNGGLFPILFALNGLTSGFAVYSLFAFDKLGPIIWIQPILLFFLLFSVIAYPVIISKSGSAAKVSVDYLMKSNFPLFGFAGILIGIILPLCLGIYFYSVQSPTPYALVVILALSRLCGDLVLRHIFFKANVYDQIV